MKNFFLLTAILSLSFLACTNQGKQKYELIHNEKYQVIEKSHWLIGNWQSESAKGILIETWRKLDDTTMIGQSYFIAGSDTLSLENIRLEQRSGKLVYIPIVRNQNNGQPVYFTMTQITDSLIVFENPEYDFPQKISYRLIKNDSLVAEVSAITDEKMRAQTFRMGKAKD